MNSMHFQATLTNLDGLSRYVVIDASTLNLQICPDDRSAVIVYIVLSCASVSLLQSYQLPLWFSCWVHQPLQCPWLCGGSVVDTATVFEAVGRIVEAWGFAWTCLNRSGRPCLLTAMALVPTWIVQQLCKN